MPEEAARWLGLLTQSLEIVGAAALVLGFVIVTVRWFHASRRMDVVSAGEGYRQSLGRVILAGLEVLVAATIIKTVTLEPTVDGMSQLAIMVAIRTALGWSTVLEMTGRWPWRQRHRS